MNRPKGEGTGRSNEPAAPQPLRRGGATSLDERAAAKLIEGYPLPPPDDLTVQRIWQRVASAPELRNLASRPRWLDLLAPSLALCLAVTLCFVVLRDHARPGSRATPVANPPQAAELAAARGGVFFSRPTERWQPGQRGQPLAEGQSLRTDPSGQALMDVLGTAWILISRGTDIAIERLNGGTFLRLSRGSVVARVLKRPPSEPFFILTHGFSVKVVGTLFEVDQDANDRTAVSVREGVVEVTGANGRSWQVRAGQKWSSDRPEQPGTSAITDPVKTLLEDGLKRANPIDLDRDLGELDSNVPVAPASSPESDARSGAGESAIVAATHKHERSPAPGPALPQGPALLRGPVLLATREAATPPATASEGTPSSDSIPAPVPVAASQPASSPPPAFASAGGTYADGLALERSGQLQAAAEEFIQAEKNDPAHADVALYALGRLRQHRLRDPQGALEAFERYRRTYPSGPLLPEVDLAVLEVEIASGRRDQALAESVRFLASHPASERTAEVHLLRGDLLRERGDCRSALAEYRQVDVAASAPFAPFSEEALFETAYCERKLGDGAAARESLRQYQQRYPSGTHRDDVAKALRE